MELLRYPNGKPIRVRNKNIPERDYPLAIIENDLPCYYAQDNFGDTYLHSIGDHKLRFQCPSGASEYYTVYVFKAEPPEIEEDFIAIDRRKEPGLCFISEMWEIRGAVRRLNFEFAPDE